MAIQKINLGTEPLGEGGDTYRSANTKINENFSNTAHAASRLVGTEDGNVPRYIGQFGLSGTGVGGRTSFLYDTTDVDTGESSDSRFKDFYFLPSGFYYSNGESHGSSRLGRMFFIQVSYGKTQGFRLASDTNGNSLYFQGGSISTWREKQEVYHTGNTTKDSKTNLLLASGESIPNNSAASRLVGIEKGQLAEWSTYNGIGGTGIGGRAKGTPNSASSGNRMKVSDLPYETGFYTKAGPLDAPVILGLTWQKVYVKTDDSTGAMLVFSSDSRDKSLYLAQKQKGEFGEWIKFYGTGNTKLDTNGAIAPSSPTIDLYSDRIETNDDGARMNPEFVRNGVGDYTIKNTTGLRDEGWYIKIPNDMNGNPKVAVAIDTDKDGNLNIKTYKRTFSMETFTFGPDLNEPLDIPEGRWIDLRFNDLPVEELYEPEPVEEPTVDVEEDPEVEEEPTEEPTEEPSEESK